MVAHPFLQCTELMPPMDDFSNSLSQSNVTTKYFIVNGECNCKDYPKAPSFWCKHRIAAGLAKRARTLAKAKLEQQNNGVSNGTTTPAPDQVDQAPVATPVQEAVATPILP